MYYQSETGIDPELRGQGLGERVARENDALLAKSKAVDCVLQRTSARSPMFKIRQKLGYRKIFDYEDADDRVLFFKNLG